MQFKHLTPDIMAILDTRTTLHLDQIALELTIIREDTTPHRVILHRLHRLVTQKKVHRSPGNRWRKAAVYPPKKLPSENYSCLAIRKLYLLHPENALTIGQINKELGFKSYANTQKNARHLVRHGFLQSNDTPPIRYSIREQNDPAPSAEPFSLEQFANANF